MDDSDGADLCKEAGKDLIRLNDPLKAVALVSTEKVLLQGHWITFFKTYAMELLIILI